MQREKREPFVHVDIGFLANNVGETATDTFNGSEGEHYLLFAIHVRVQYTKNVLKVLVRHQRLQNYTATILFNKSIYKFQQWLV